MQKLRAPVSKENGLCKLVLQRMAKPENSGRRIGVLEKVAGSSPVGHTPTGNLLIQEKGSERVPGELIMWFDLGIFTGIEQAHLEPSSPLELFAKWLIE